MCSGCRYSAGDKIGWHRCDSVIFSHRLCKIEILCFDGTDSCKKVSDTSMKYL